MGSTSNGQIIDGVGEYKISWTSDETRQLLKPLYTKDGVSYFAVKAGDKVLGEVDGVQLYPGGKYAAVEYTWRVELASYLDKLCRDNPGLYEYLQKGQHKARAATMNQAFILKGKYKRLSESEGRDSLEVSLYDDGWR